MKHIIISIVVICMLISSACAAGEMKDSVVVDKTKETLKEIDKGIQVRDTSADVAKYDVLKEKDKITISKADTVKDKKIEHTKTKLVMDEKTAKSIDVDKDGKFGYLRKVNGQVVDIKVVTLAELTTGIDATFSEVIVNGYSGYKQYTFSDVESGDTLNIDDVDGNYTITGAVSGTVPTYTAGIPTNGLLAEWTFDELNYIDSSGNGHTGTKSGTVLFADDKNGGKCLYFNATNGYINVGTIALGNKNATLIADVKPATLTSAAYRHIFSRYYGQNSIRIGATGYSTSVMNNIGSMGPSLFSNTTWNQIALTYNGSLPSAQIKIYQNGIYDVSATLTANITNEANGWAIGADGINSPDRYFKGYIDNVRAYTQPLTASELRQVYAGGSGISFQPEPSYNFTGYNVASGVEKVLNTDSTCTGIEYVDTTGGTHDVVVTVYFTEDITEVTDSHTAFVQTVNITHTSTNTADNGSIIPYEILDGYDGTAVLTTNNTNASISQNETHFIISTGYISAGSTYYYLVEIPTIRITGYTPTNNNVSNLYDENTLYTVHVSEASDIVWKIDNSTYKTVSGVTSDSLSYGSTFNVGMHNITANIINSYGDLTDSNTWNVDVYTNSFQNMGSSLTDDINESYLLMGTLLISLMGITILIILYGAFTGKIDIPLALMAVLVIIISSALMVISIIMLNALIELI